MGQASRHLSRLLRRVAGGVEAVIAKVGRLLVRLVPFQERRQDRRLGTETGRITVTEDFDAPLPPDVRGAKRGLRA